MTSPLDLRIGLTGSIGAGKSTVAQLLRQRRYAVLDADEQARLVTAEPEVLSELSRLFPGVVRSGTLDRAALAAQVFGNPSALARLNAVTHPRVRARMQALERVAHEQGRVVIQDIPLLFESGQRADFDVVLVVDAPLEVRVQRVMARSNLSREDVLARDARQLSAQQKREQASAVIENGGDLQALEHELEQVLMKVGLPLWVGVQPSVNAFSINH